MKRPLFTSLIAINLAACTSIPDRFNTSDKIYDGCGYSVSGETSEGFSLEVAYTEYKFFPSPDPVILAARDCFANTAIEIARRKGRTIVPIGAGDMNTTSNRNVVDAKYLVNVTGKVRYAPR